MRNASGHESQNVRQPKKVSGNTQHFLHKTCSRGKQRQRDVQKGAGRAKLFFFTVLVVFTDSYTILYFVWVNYKL